VPPSRVEGQEIIYAPRANGDVRIATFFDDGVRGEKEAVRGMARCIMRDALLVYNCPT